MKKIISIFIISLCIGCIPTNRELVINNPSTPIAFKSSSNNSIAVLKVAMSPPLKDAVIGHFHELSPLFYISKSLTFHGMDASVHVKNTAMEITEELRTAKYPVQEELTFSTNTVQKPDLLIEGIVGALKYDIYSITGSQRRAESTAKVSWAVFDTHKKEIIYKKITTGSVKGPFSIGVDAVTITGVVVDSFRKVLADKNFVALVQKGLDRK